MTSPERHATKSQQLAIRAAVPSDALAIAKIGAKTFTISFTHSMPAEHVQAYLDKAYSATTISKEIDDPRNQFFVASSPASEVIGFIQMKLGTTDPCLPQDVPLCELNRVYVSSDHLGGGTGQLLLQRGLDWAKEQLLGSVAGASGADTERRAGVWLGGWEENPKAQRLYRRSGFEAIGEHDFLTGNTRQTDLVMLKWL